MKHIVLVATLFATLMLAACGESKLPVATGKGDIRAINAIIRSPDVGFLIEERTIGSAGFRQITSASAYDNLSYNFNFEVIYAGELSTTRIATTSVDVIADMDYIFVLTGTLGNAAVSIWETASRGFSGSETVFEVRFAHTSDTLGTVDYYFAAPGVAPVLGEAQVTLGFGDLAPAVDLEAGDYVLTITAAGDPNNVLFESEDTTFAGASQFIVTTFDGGATTFAPYFARAIPTSVDAADTSVAMTDRNYPPMTEFVNAALDLGTVDIYDDETLTSQIVAGHAYTDVSDELELTLGDNTVYYTPTTLLSPVLIDSTFSTFAGFRGRTIAYGEVDSYLILNYIPDRRPVDTAAKLQMFNSAISSSFLDVYILDADETIEDKVPRSSFFATGTTANTVNLAAGSYDIFVTEFNVDEVLAGPIRIDVEIGDVVEAIILDTVDPAMLEFKILSD